MAASPTSPPRPKSPRSPLAITNGVFQNGAWYCNCGLIARRKTVRKSSKNYGRTFYMCSVERGGGNFCDFFLWGEDAERRERAGFMSNGRSEKRQTTLLESMAPRKGKQKAKQPAGKFLYSMMSADELAAVGGASTSRTADASKPNAAAAAASAAAESSTLRESGNGTSSRSANNFDTTSEEEEAGEYTRLTRSHATTNKNPNLQPSAMARTPTGPPTSSKRKRPLDDDEHDLLDDLSSSGEEELMAMSDLSAKHYNAFTTPRAPRTADVKDGMPTPSLTMGRSTKKVLFKGVGDDNCIRSSVTPSAKRQRLEARTAAPPSNASAAVQLWGTSAVIKGPAPASSSSASASASASAPGTEAGSSPQKPAVSDVHPEHLTTEVMDLLKDGAVAKSVRDAVRKAIDRYVSQAKGYERGRDAARKVAKDAEDRVARLQSKVDALETSRQELRTQLMDMWNKL
ncbi:hypothetical protein GGR50DRAFT_704118 [Xylaria sp. CBS 124048]|nr:hypothetical protein GGR50DRAFT_704118 [Xylaria sp. CBS 124048]